ncbi:tetratricopeptide repeat protein [Saccharicrinis sp. GN24d3]|uniref:tetratricopeptide repeat protein n=1 Tax=Saccharicrinis sp. GN24d3 TaxID=3458416 RepID=UPI004036FA91
MRNLYLLLVLIIGIVGCKSVKEAGTVELVTSTKGSVLSGQNKRKFDYFFYEGQRLKMNGDLNKAKNYFVECLKIDSLSATCYFELANIAIAAKNYKAAQDLLSNSVRLSPNNKWYQILLGDLYQQNKEIPKAIATYEKLVERFPDSDEFTYILAQLYQNNKQFQNAIDAYNKLQNSIGINEAISTEKEKIYLEMGKEGMALKEINRLIDENPYEPRYYGFLGDLYMYNKNYSKAEQSYNKILEVDAGNGMGFFSLANVKLQQADTISFFNYFGKALEDEDLALEVKFQQLLPLLMGKDFKEYNDTTVVIGLFNKLTDVHNDDARSYIYYANYLQNNNKKKAALVEYKKALSIDKSNPSVWQDMFFLEIDLAKFDDLYEDAREVLVIFPEVPLFNLFYAMGAMQKEEYQNAREKLLNGLKFVGENAALKGQFHAYLGDVEHSLGKPNEAFKHYENALKIDENNVVVLNNYSYYLSVENKELEKAEKMISRCIELESGNATYLDTYAWVLFKRGRFFEAKYIIERAMDNGGDSSEVIVEHYGDILFMNNKVNEAIVQWKKSLEMGNKSEVLKRKIELKEYVEE